MIPQSSQIFTLACSAGKLRRHRASTIGRIHSDPTNGNHFDGGLAYRPSDGPSCWLPYVTVDSVDAAIARAQRMGASIVRQKSAVPRTGWYSVLVDPQGNFVAIWQTDPTAFPAPEPA
jgi:uncharacterized protein